MNLYDSSEPSRTSSCTDYRSLMTRSSLYQIRKIIKVSQINYNDFSYFSDQFQFSNYFFVAMFYLFFINLQIIKNVDRKQSFFVILWEIFMEQMFVFFFVVHLKVSTFSLDELCVQTVSDRVFLIHALGRGEDLDAT